MRVILDMREQRCIVQREGVVGAHQKLQQLVRGHFRMISFCEKISHTKKMKPPQIPSPEQWKQLYDTCSAVGVDMVRLLRSDPSFSTGDIAQQTRCMANALLVESNATTSPKKQSRAKMQGLLAVHRVEGGVFVDYICVAASHRHRGIGKFLLELVHQPAFVIVASLSSAMRFYAKRGYQLCISMPYLPGIGEIGMTRHSSTECDHALPSSIDVTRTVVHGTWND